MHTGHALGVASASSIYGRDPSFRVAFGRDPSFLAASFRMPLL